MGTSSTMSSSLHIDRGSGDRHNHHHGLRPTRNVCLRIITALLRGILGRLLYLRTAADAMPVGLIHLVLVQGINTSMTFIAAYLAFLALWLPFKLLSLAITELGVYIVSICAIFGIGRGIIRLIAFPGASPRVAAEIEAEFAKYSVRMIGLASQSVMEVTQAIVASSSTNTIRRASGNTTAMLYDLPVFWNRAKSYRNRILGVYVEVLLYLYQQPSMPNTAQQQQQQLVQPDLTRFGNNRLSGDVGNLSGLTPQARTDGRELMERLQNVLELLDRLDEIARPVLEAGLGPGAKNPLTEDAFAIAAQLLEAATELRDFSQSLRPSNTSGSAAADEEHEGEYDDDYEEDLTMDAVRRKFEEQGSAVDVVRNSISSILSMLDPPLHNSIFGLDVQRGCMMSRYRGSRQLWVRRPNGGMLDVLHFPAKRDDGSTAAAVLNPRAVLYCNPNAGLIEVAAGMSLVGGNIPSATPDSTSDNSWIDYYTSLGLDVFVYNYAGYGRSFGTTLCSSAPESAYHPGVCARLSRIFHSTFLAFAPTPDSLRSDARAVAEHLTRNAGIEALIIHGESIGGMAAAGAANALSHAVDTRNKLALLVCDRTFCNLEAVAQRLVGGWSGYAIRCLAPFWNTNVAGDFIAAACPKIVATDAADCIINDAPSLKAGVALWKEIHRGFHSTKGLGWMSEEPLQYRMADFENCCVNDSKYLAGQGLFRVKSPVWPADKHISVEEAFHFAACCKRIGRVAKEYRASSGDSEQAVEFSLSLGHVSESEPIVCDAWKVLACCDGLTGTPLGVAVKLGFDTTVAWLCSCLIYGSQRIVTLSDDRVRRGATAQEGIEAADFDARPPGFESEESDVLVHPKPIPEVLSVLVALLESGDESLSKLAHELQYVVGTLQYIQDRLSAAPSIEAARHCRELQPSADASVGCFMNLHCGHNNPFSKEEKLQLKALLDKALAAHDDGSSLELSVV